MNRDRLSSHKLRIETGRWSRIPREERLCPCLNGVQTEKHVLLHCEHTQDIRNKHMITQSELDMLFQLEDDPLTNFVYEIMKKMTP